MRIKVDVVFFLNCATKVQDRLAAVDELVQEVDGRETTLNRDVRVSAIGNHWDIRVDDKPRHSAAVFFIRSNRAFSAA